MKLKLYPSLKALCLAPLAALCLVSAGAHAQTAPAMSPSASMPMGQMSKSAAGCNDMMSSMMMGMEGMLIAVRTRKVRCGRRIDS